MARDIKCETCLFWERVTHGSRDYWGYCHKRAPVAGAEDKWLAHKPFPPTRDVEWCGEYLAAPEPTLAAEET